MQKRYADGYEAGNKMLAFLDQKDNSILACGAAYNLMTEFCYQLNKYDETLEYIDRFIPVKRNGTNIRSPNLWIPFLTALPL